MIDSVDKNLCTGCGACRLSCPKTCIEMKPAEDGFLYPQINASECICCNACEGVCPVLNTTKPTDVPTAYAAFAKDNEIKLSSSSGGIFTVLANEIISRGGVVFGVAFDDSNRVVHNFCETAEDLSALRGSKYVQSNTGDSFKIAKQYLDAGRPVYFSGTPCQIAGLVAYLKKDYDNLFTQDIICHGAPSPLVLEKYLKYLTPKNTKINKVSFRNKDSGWKNYNILINFQDNSSYRKVLHDDVYMKLFLSDLTLRKSCYNCSFKTPYRVSDITLADFWGIENIMPAMDDDSGTSLVLINSQKGKDLFSCVSSDIIYNIADADVAIKYNPAAVKSAAHNPLRDNFFEDLNTMDFSNLERKYCYVSPISKLITSFKRSVKKIIRK